MAKRNKNQANAGGNQANASDTEFGAELGLSKKARKKAARESKKVISKKGDKIIHLWMIFVSFFLK